MGKNYTFANRQIAELNLNVRTASALARLGKKTIGEIMEMTVGELLDIRNLGAGSVGHITRRIEEADLYGEIEDLKKRVEFLEGLLITTEES